MDGVNELMDSVALDRDYEIVSKAVKEEPVSEDESLASEPQSFTTIEDLHPLTGIEGHGKNDDSLSDVMLESDVTLCMPSIVDLHDVDLTTPRSDHDRDLRLYSEQRQMEASEFLPVSGGCEQETEGQGHEDDKSNVLYTPPSVSCLPQFDIKNEVVDLPFAVVGAFTEAQVKVIVAKLSLALQAIFDEKTFQSVVKLPCVGGVSAPTATPLGIKTSYCVNVANSESTQTGREIAIRISKIRIDLLHFGGRASFDLYIKSQPGLTSTPIVIFEKSGTDTLQVYQVNFGSMARIERHMLLSRTDRTGICDLYEIEQERFTDVMVDCIDRWAYRQTEERNQEEHSLRRVLCRLPGCLDFKDRANVNDNCPYSGPVLRLWHLLILMAYTWALLGLGAFAVPDTTQCAPKASIPLASLPFVGTTPQAQTEKQGLDIHLLTDTSALVALPKRLRDHGAHPLLVNVSRAAQDKDSEEEVISTIVQLTVDNLYSVDWSVQEAYGNLTITAAADVKLDQGRNLILRQVLDIVYDNDAPLLTKLSEVAEAAEEESGLCKFNAFHFLNKTYNLDRHLFEKPLKQIHRVPLPKLNVDDLSSNIKSVYAFIAKDKEHLRESLQSVSSSIKERTSNVGQVVKDQQQALRAASRKMHNIKDEMLLRGDKVQRLFAETYTKRFRKQVQAKRFRWSKKSLFKSTNTGWFRR